MNKTVEPVVFKRPYLVIEKIFERVGLTCSKSGGRLDICTACNEAGTAAS